MMMRQLGLCPRSLLTLTTACVAIAGGARTWADLTLRLENFATVPKTGATGAAGDPTTIFPNSVYLARVNFLAEEPGGGRNRLFVNDLNGPLYILDKTTKQFAPYLNFNGKNGRPGMFSEFTFEMNFAAGLITFQFDPDYANNGKFYTVHMEQDGGSPVGPVNTVSYATTPRIDAPGNTARTTVLLEWTDTNITNSTFEGSARELFRMDQVGNIHPMGDLIFNPNAAPGDPDWRVMYISIGDGGAGEQSNTGTRHTPQRLDSFGGKVLRIIPDLGLHTDTSTVSAGGTYRIPNDNPFTSMPEAAIRDEIFALGMRNPHRISWDPDTDTILVNDIGLHTWEEVNIIHPGGNYGYSIIEGNEVLGSNNQTNSDPLPATVPRRIGESTTSGTMTPLYPVAQYGHGDPGQGFPEGDSISSGYVYRGSNIPSLHGKYIFGEVTTGQLFWCDFDEMLAADDGNPETMAEIHNIDVLWDDPNTPAGATLYSTTDASGVLGPMHQIVRAGYVARGGTDENLPGGAAVTGPNGRADIRLQVDESGELFILSKSDGMIRYIVEAAGNGDFDGDGRVNGNDFLIWQTNLGSLGGLAQGDADGDGRVTHADLSLWQRAFAADALPRAVPEPLGGFLAAASLVVLAAGRRRSTRRQ
jgi:hypothetical protein